MKRFYISLLLALMALPMLAQENIVLLPKSDLRQYRFYYIIPSGDSYSQGDVVSAILWGGDVANTRTTTSQTEVMSSVLMSRDYIRLPHIDPAVAEETMIVSYSVTRTEVSGRQVTALLQITDGKTHELVCKALATRTSSSTGEALSSVLHDCLIAVLHIPACANPTESAELSLALGGEAIEPKDWPEVGLSYLEKLVEQWQQIETGENQVSEPFKSAYREAMMELFRNPTVRNANDISNIGKYAAKYKANKKEAKFDKRLSRYSKADDRIITLIAHCYYN